MAYLAAVTGGGMDRGPTRGFTEVIPECENSYNVNKQRSHLHIIITIIVFLKAVLHPLISFSLCVAHQIVNQS